MSGGLRSRCSKLLFQHDDNRVVPGVVEILFRWCDVDPLARSAPVSVRHGMQRLMDVGDEMDEKGEVAGRSPFIVIPLANPTCILVDLRRDAIPLGTPPQQI